MHVFEDKYPDDPRPRLAIEGIRLFHKGLITQKELDVLANEADNFFEFDNTSFYAAYASFYAIFCAKDCADSAAYAVEDADTTYKEKWQEIEGLFIKHFVNVTSKQVIMTPKLARKVHEMRGKHIPYQRIAKSIDPTLKRASMQSYYYQWLKRTGRKPWGFE